MKTLATRTAELHRALATPTGDEAFTPLPITAEDLQQWRARVQTEARDTLALLSAQLAHLPPAAATVASELLEGRERLAQKLQALAPAVPAGLKIRHHGDYHLGQVLVRRNDFFIVDFEGEPGRPLADRRVKHSPLRDVAGMLRSFTYAARAAMQKCVVQSTEDCARWERMLEMWETQTRAIFIGTYDNIARPAGLYRSWEEVAPLLTLFEIEKALYETRYELSNRPDWVGIPLRSLNAFTH